MWVNIVFDFFFLKVSSGARLSDASDERNVLDDAGYTGIDEVLSIYLFKIRL